MVIRKSDAAYYRKREQHERELVKAASAQEARIIHQQLADKYRSLAEAAELEQIGVEQVAVTGLPAEDGQALERPDA